MFLETLSDPEFTTQLSMSARGLIGFGAAAVAVALAQASRQAAIVVAGSTSGVLALLLATGSTSVSPTEGAQEAAVRETLQRIELAAEVHRFLAEGDGPGAAEAEQAAELLDGVAAYHRRALSSGSLR